MGLEVDVLIVDDDDDLAQLFKLLLEQEGYICSVAHNGLAALQTLAIIRPQLVLLDLVMPVMDGFSVLARLPEDHPPIIVVTGATIPVTGIAHTAAVLHKPVKAQELVDTVRATLTRTGATP